jgi:hypothetical protein
VAKIEIGCNVHASSYVKSEHDHEGLPDVVDPDDTDVFDDDDDVGGVSGELLTPIGLTGEYVFEYTYPLTNPAKFAHILQPSMTGEDILAFARSDYERIYSVEETIAGNPGHIPGMLNRETSCGPYGVWGHDFSDLFFESIEIDDEAKTIELGMGS